MLASMCSGLAGSSLAGAGLAIFGGVATAVAVAGGLGLLWQAARLSRMGASRNRCFMRGWQIFVLVYIEKARHASLRSA